MAVYYTNIPPPCSSDEVNRFYILFLINVLDNFFLNITYTN